MWLFGNRSSSGFSRPITTEPFLSRASVGPSQLREGDTPFVSVRSASLDAEHVCTGQDLKALERTDGQTDGLPLLFYSSLKSSHGVISVPIADTNDT